MIKGRKIKMTTQNLKCSYFRWYLCLLCFEWICLAFGFWDLEFSHQIATPHKSELAMTRRGRSGWPFCPVIAGQRSQAKQSRGRAWNCHTPFGCSQRPEREICS